MNIVTNVGTRLLTLSDYRIISPVQIHPQAAEVEQIVTKLCKDLGIYLKQYRDYTTMSMYIYPNTTLERLVAIQLLMNILWYLDDHYDRDTVYETDADKRRRQEVYVRCVEILRTGQLPREKHLLYPVFYELYERIGVLSSAAWLNRLADSMIEHMKASIGNREALLLGDDIDVAQYMYVRELDSGMRPTIYMLEFAHNIYLPDEVLQHPYLKTMNLRCARIGSLTNDIFSYHKEVIKLGSYYNLLRVFMESEHLSFDEAVHESVMLINGIIDDFLQDAEDIPVWKDKSIEKMVIIYVNGLRDIVNASWHWQISTNRYRSPESPFPELRTMLD
jgi:hypothetical protein